MSYIKPGGRTWIKTELNDPPLQTIYDEIEDRIWGELFPHGLPKAGSTITYLKRHEDWCDDGTCWCRRSTSGGSSRDTTPPGASGS